MTEPTNFSQMEDPERRFDRMARLVGPADK